MQRGHDQGQDRAVLTESTDNYTISDKASLHWRHYDIDDHIFELWSWKRLHTDCRVSAKGQKSCSVTCTFLRAIYQMWWRQNLFQEPTLSPFTFHCPLQHILLWSFVSHFSWSFLHFYWSPYLFCQHLTNLQDPGKNHLSHEVIHEFSVGIQGFFLYASRRVPAAFALEYNYLCTSCFLHFILSSLKTKDMPYHGSMVPNSTLKLIHTQ